MSQELGIVKSMGAFENRLNKLSGTESDSIALRNALFASKLGGGLLRFAGALYPGVAAEDVYAQVHDREPEGRGAHFDVYDSVLAPDTPWVGVYNLAGRVSLRAAKLPEDLADSYLSRFPDPTTEAAYTARREFSAIAFLQPDTDVLEGVIEPGMGMVLLQRAGSPYIIHELTPQDENHPGKFVKLVHPAANVQAKRRLKGKSYTPLDELVTTNLTENGRPNLSLVPSPGKSLPEIAVLPSFDFEDDKDAARPPGRRHCIGFD